LRFAPALGAAVIYLLLISVPRLWHDVIWPQAMAPHGAVFLDMRGHLASSAAHANGTLRQGEPVPGDPLQRIHAGPTSMLWLGFLGLGPEHTAAFTAACLIAFLLTATVVASPASTVEALYLWLVLTSPPLLLLVERGNIDLLVFAVIATAFWLLGRPKPAARWTSWGIIAGFMGFKYYPAAAFAALPETSAPRREKIVALALGLLVSGLFVVWQLPALRFVAAHLVENRFYPFFGVREFPVMAGYDYTSAPRIGAVIWLVLVAALTRLLGPVAAPESARDPRKIAFAGGTAVLLFCFLATSSPDYRLVFFLFCLPWLGSLRATATAAGRVATTCLALFLCAAWIGPTLGRAALAVEAPRIWGTLMLLKQACWWGITAGLAALCLRASWPRYRELAPTKSARPGDYFPPGGAK
jgi:hypothetical protein